MFVDTKNINNELIQLINENKESSEIKEFLKKNEYTILFHEQLFENSFKHNSYNVIELLCKGNWSKNQNLKKNNRKYSCTKNLINILRNGSFNFSSSFFANLLKYDRLDYIKYILENYLYNNQCILSILVFRKESNGDIFKDGFIGRIINHEKSKVKIDINDLFQISKDHNLYYKYNSCSDSYHHSLNLTSYILDCANKNIITVNIPNDEEKKYEKLLLSAISSNNSNIVEWIMIYAKKHHVNINLNDEIFHESPLSIPISNSNNKIVKLILKYADEEFNILKYCSDKKICFTLLNAMAKDKVEIVTSIMQYIISNDIDIDINYQDDYCEEKLLFYATKRKNYRLVKMVIDYAIKKKKKIDLVDESHDNICLPIMISILEEELEIIILIIQYIINYNIEFNINYRDNISDENLLSYATRENSMKLFKMVMSYVDKYKVKLIMSDYYNDKLCLPIMNVMRNDNLNMALTIMKYINKEGINVDINYSYEFTDKNIISYATRKNSTELVNLIIEYAESNNIILDFSDYEYNNNKYSPIMNSIRNDNFSMVKMLMEYIDSNGVNFNCNIHDIAGDNLLSYATNKNNIELIKMIIKYANKHNVILRMVDYYDEDKICSPLIYAFENDNLDMVRILMKYINEKNIKFNINYKVGSERKNLLSYAIEKKSVTLLKEVIDYSNNNNKTIDLSDDEISEYNNIIISVMKYKNIDMALSVIISIMKYLIKNDDINIVNCEKDPWNRLLFFGINNNSTELVDLILKYDGIKKENNNNFFKIVEAKKYSLLNYAMKKDNIDIVKKILNYIIKNEINFNINKNISVNIYLFLYAAYKNDLELVQTIIKYANTKKRILKLTVPGNNKLCPLYYGYKYKNKRIIELISNYAFENGINPLK